VRSADYTFNGEKIPAVNVSASRGKNGRIHLTLCNLACVFAQLASGTILGNFSFKSIYLVAFSIMALFFLLSFFGLKKMPDPKYDSLRSLNYVKAFVEKKPSVFATKLKSIFQESRLSITIPLHSDILSESCHPF